MTEHREEPPIGDLDAAVETGIAHHRAGRLVEAEALYGEILRLDPQHVGACRNLALVFLSRKQPGRALPLLVFVTTVDPDNPKGWGAYIQALTADGQFETAERLLRDQPALETMRLGLEVRLRQTWALNLIDQGDLEGAEAQFRRVLALKPDDAESSADLGFIQLRRGRAEAAVASLERALQLAPDHAAALVNLGSALKALERNAEAVDCYRRALVVNPDDAVAIRNLGILLNQLERYDEALVFADQALARSRSSEALMIRGAALHGLGRFEAALADHLEAARTDTARYEALIKAARAHSALGRHDAALEVLDTAIGMRPEAPLALMQRAMVRLAIRDFAGGWRDYEARWRDEAFIAQSSAVVSPSLRARLNLGLDLSDIAGRRVLLVGEQGIGDLVMFASMIPDLAATAAKVTCVCDRRLIGLFSASFAGVTFLDPATDRLAFSDFDKVVPMGSLGRLFRNGPEDFPGRPYLRPRAEVCERWTARLGPRTAGLRIGLSWRGGGANTRTGQRSLALDQLAPILALPDCEFVSLQYGDRRAEVAEASARMGREIRLFPAGEIDDFEDLAGLVEALDVVVSVQTALVHLAGAIGKACLTLVPHNPEWRYTANSSSMPWYRSVRLFRQSTPGDWAPVIQDVTDALQSHGRR